MALCWRVADAWRQEAADDALDALTFAIQDELYEPCPGHSRALARAMGAVPRPAATGPNGMRARRAQGMVDVVKGTAASLLSQKPRGTRPILFGYYFPHQWSFTTFLARALWVFPMEELATWITEALGERLLVERGAWRPDREAPEEE